MQNKELANLNELIQFDLLISQEVNNRSSNNSIDIRKSIEMGKMVCN
jgi:hypothetical protein